MRTSRASTYCPCMLSMLCDTQHQFRFVCRRARTLLQFITIHQPTHTQHTTQHTHTYTHSGADRQSDSRPPNTRNNQPTTTTSRLLRTYSSVPCSSTICVCSVCAPAKPITYLICHPKSHPIRAHQIVHPIRVCVFVYVLVLVRLCASACFGVSHFIWRAAAAI